MSNMLGMSMPDWCMLGSSPFQGRSQDWRALWKILRDVPLTGGFERPADPKFLERLDLDREALEAEAEASAPQEGKEKEKEKEKEEKEEDKEEKEEKEEGKEGKEEKEGKEGKEKAKGPKEGQEGPKSQSGTADPSDDVSALCDLVSGAVNSDGAEADDDTPNAFDPEGPVDFDFDDEPSAAVGYQLLQHVDSPQHEDPDEAACIGTSENAQSMAM